MLAKNSSTLVIFLAVSTILCSAYYLKPPRHLLPKDRETYKIPLDADSYLDKWRDVIKPYKPYMQATIKPLVLAGFKVTDALLQKFAAIVALHNFMPEHIAEIKAIAELSDIDYPTMLAYNLVYEYFAFCTSTITEDADGNIIHGRNLDYDFTTEMGPLFVDGLFTRNGTVVHRAAFLVGYIGHSTGMAEGKFAVSINQRRTPNGNVHDNIFEMLDRGGIPVTWLTRAVLENAVSWQDALAMLNTTKIAAPVYYILSGTKHNEGVIISRGRETVDDIEFLDCNGSEQKWLLVQTNIDRNYPYKDYRKEKTTERILEIGRESIKASNLYEKVLSLYPTFNKITIFLNVMSAQSGFFNTTYVYQTCFCFNFIVYSWTCLLYTSPSPRDQA
eukprot:TRINITY_DN8550_c0_g1_i2.p1 TRINITY_DN8550_c0_g1~~TRINITY_DN8550_c0_g1_i2.p1  ORF type:complete len:388 (-),score=49.05 TRINITY_DN8550_c0_g1_i2:35-1198(-)